MRAATASPPIICLSFVKLFMGVFLLACVLLGMNRPPSCSAMRPLPSGFSMIRQAEDLQRPEQDGDSHGELLSLGVNGALDLLQSSCYDGDGVLLDDEERTRLWSMAGA
jgi:hypothetical protein